VSLSPDMHGNPYLVPGEVDTNGIQDMADHPDMNMPAPGYSPPAQHSLKMAGDVIPMRGEDSPGVPQGERIGNVLKASGAYLGKITSPKITSIRGRFGGQDGSRLMPKN